MENRKKVGLILGAGGARGYAHIGVLQVLEENNIPVDVVTGCSMGALVGGLYVAGCDMYILEKFADNFDMMKYADFKFKTGGFIGGNKILELIKVFTKGIKIKQAVIPYCCVAVDIGSAELKAFDGEYYLHDAVRASISIPGAFAPYNIDGRTYIDGGVLERLPIDEAKALGADVTIAIDVNYRGWEQPKPKNLVETISLTMNVPDWYLSRQNEKKADVLIVPDIKDYDPFDFSTAKDIVELGRRAAIDNLEKIKELVNGEG